MTDLTALDLNDLARLKVLVVGDFMLDEYVWGQVERISPEAPVMVVNIERQTQVLGGAGNVVNNLIGLGAQVTVMGLVGQDIPGAALKTELARLGVDPYGLFVDSQRQTTLKTRVLGGNQQIVRIDRENRQPAPHWFIDEALKYFAVLLPDLDAVILSDYGKGVLIEPLLAAIIARGREGRLPVVVDPKGQDYSRYRGVTVITPNRKEAELAAGYSLHRREDLLRAGQEMCRACDTDALLITLGAEGMILFSQDQPPQEIPAQAREVFDVSGAGDTVVAVMALGLARWRQPLLAARLANLAAGIVVGKIGTAPILLSELTAALHSLPASRPEKILQLPELRLLAPRLQAQGKRLVFTNGCFDLLHWGHIKFLEESRRLGDILIVALDTDESVRRVKGPCRPVIHQDQRLRMLAATRGRGLRHRFFFRTASRHPGRLETGCAYQGQQLPRCRSHRS